MPEKNRRNDKNRKELNTVLSIISNWIYVFITTFALGFGVSLGVERFCKYKIKRLDSLLMTGIVAATVYAQFFSLFYKVSLVANIVLIVMCAVILFLGRADLKEMAGQWKEEISVGKVIIVIGLYVLWAYFTSRGYFHYDSDLYHGQSIRWIEEYGIVKGLGNIHERFAYNSSSFALSALYSMPYLFGKSMHTMNGFLAFVLSLSCLSIGKSWRVKAFSLANIAKVAAIYYLTTITNEVVAPASDYFVMCVLFFIVIRWLDCLEEDAGKIAPFALLCVLGVYALTLKLTAGLILLLLVKPAYMLIKEKRGKEIACYLGIGLLVALPWMIREVLISGWLLYPFTALDLFSVDWKMNAEFIEIDAAQIKVWGRALYDVTKLDWPIWKWFPNWFQTTLSSMEKLIILGDLASLVISAVLTLYVFLKKKWVYLEKLLVLWTIAACYLFWQFSAPLIRYGYTYALLLVFLAIILAFEVIFETKPLVDKAVLKKRMQAVVYFGILAYGCYKLATTTSYILETKDMPYYLTQQTYGVYELETFEVDGETFYYPLTGDRTGYESFPSVPCQKDFELRGEGFKDGFRPQKP